MIAELRLQERARCAVELALLETPVDRVLERGVGALAAGVLRREQRCGGGDQDRRIEEDELLDGAGVACRQLECDAAAERVSNPRRRLIAHRVQDGLDVRSDAPRRLVRRSAVAEQVRRQHTEACESFGQAREVAAVAGNAMQADDARRGPIAPGVELEPAHPVCSSVSSDSGTISVRRSSSFTSDQITVPALSIRKVPRIGAPLSSLKTP